MDKLELALKVDMVRPNIPFASLIGSRGDGPDTVGPVRVITAGT